MLGTRDQTNLSVTYTRGSPPRISPKHAGMFAEKGILVANASQFRPFNCQLTEVFAYFLGA